MLRILAAVGVFALTSLASVAAPPRSVDSLIVQLGSDFFAEREAAGRALEAVGSGAIPALEGAARSQNPEVSRRAGEILGRLRRAEESVERIKPRMVRLAYKNEPLGKAVNDLKIRTGAPLKLDPTKIADPLRPITCETEELPVWQAVEAFCRAAQVREVFAAELPIPKVEARNRRAYSMPVAPPVADTIEIVLADGVGEVVVGSRATAVRVLLLPRSFPSHRVTLGTGEVNLAFDVCPTPGLHWQDVAAVRVTRLIDDSGRYGTGGLLVEPGPNPFDPFGGQIIINRGGRMMVFRGNFDESQPQPTTQPNPRVVPVPLKIASPGARSLRRLEGIVLGELLVPAQPLVTIKDPAKHVGAVYEVAGGVRVILSDVRSTPTETTLRIQLDLPNGPISPRRRNALGIGFWPEAPRSTDMEPKVQAFDATDQLLGTSGKTYSEVNDDGETFTTTLQLTYRGAAPTKLVVVGPKTTIVEVPFALENILLP